MSNELDSEASSPVTIETPELRRIMRHLAQNPAALFFDWKIRTYIARRRATQRGTSDRFLQENDHMIGGAIGYNQTHMNNFLESHVVRLIRPLSIIDPVYQNAKYSTVLSIGPRNENELFHLWAYGFDINNISAIDLVSNSPLVQIMDMHELTFPDNHFDVVISGWTLPYSRNPKLALAEKMRVLKSGGLLCLGLTREPPGGDQANKIAVQGAVNYLTADQILADIAAPIAKVEFCHEPLDKSRKGAILLIVRAAWKTGGETSIAPHA